MAKKARRQGQGEVSENSVVYRGPTRVTTGNNTRTTTTCLVRTGTPAGNATTGMYLDIGTETVNSCNDWSSFAGIYGEYRVLALEVTWVPNYNSTYATGGLTQAVGAAGMYHDNVVRVSGGVTTFASLADVCTNPAWKIWHTGERAVWTWRATGTEEMQFSPIAVLTRHGSIAGWIPGATSTSNYGTMFYSYVVQFRGRV